MKFIHTADLHLDSPLRGLAAYPDAPVERLRTATRDAFRNLVALALDEKVDFMVIAGDLYDGKWKDFNTGLFFVRQMGRLREAGIPVFVLYGNHDAESEMTRSLQLPDNVSVFSSREAQTFKLDGKKVALHGRSFKEAATTSNLVPGYPLPVDDWLNIGVLHTALEGNAEHARYAPCSIAELQAKGYQYWALGHVHEHWIQRGDVTVAYPGNLQGRHIKELGARCALLVTAEGSEIIDVKRIEVDVLRWHVLDVDVSTTNDRTSAVRLAGQRLSFLLQSSSDGCALAVRVVFSGSSVVHQELVADEQQLRQEVIAQAVALDPDRIWIERVRVIAKPAPIGHATINEDALDALSELQSMALTAHEDEEFLNDLRSDLQPLLDVLAAEVLQISPELEALRAVGFGQASVRIREAMPLVAARIVRNASNDA